MPNECDSVITALFSQPWAILQADLRAMIAIAQRETSDIIAAAGKRAERAANGGVDWGRTVAVIPVYGPIIPRASYFDEICGATSLTRLSGALDDAVADPDVESILFDIDSPGGQVTGIHEFAEKIRAARKTKPVEVYVSGTCASAAYWIATAAGKITAVETAEIGSIGVVCAWTDDSEAMAKQGLKRYEVVSSQSPNKRLDPKTKAGRSELQRHLDGLAAIFIKDVARSRGTTVDDVENNYGEGSVILAAAALDVGMIDAIGVMDTAVLEIIGSPTQEFTTMGKTGIMQSTAKPKTKGKNGKAVTKPEDDEEDDLEATDAEPEDDDEEDDETGATTDPNDDDEEDEDDPPKENTGKGKTPTKTKSSMLLKNIKASYPDVYKAAFQAGVQKERARIQAIHDLKITGHGALVKRAMFETPMSAEKLSFAILKAENGARESLGDDIRQESASAIAPVDPVGGDDTEAAKTKRQIALMSGKALK